MGSKMGTPVGGISRASSESTLAADSMEKLKSALMHPRTVRTVDQSSEGATIRERPLRGGAIETCLVFTEKMRSVVARKCSYR